ncbi:ECF transporter S component [Micromonospora sp. NPDC047707]|uniref:ECF transporter S component n=1 Tax=Micromonospora sp. NPDC047707 TaxID=3154498 RepID=UPI00345228DA
MSVLRVAPRTAVVLALASAAALATFTWPLFIPAHPEATARAGEAPLVFVVMLPVLVALVLAELTSGGIDSKALAMLGVLAAVNAALRPLGAGTAGIETVFFLLVLAGRVFGPGFGFLLGSTSLFASALLTAGVGPWLPFQMLAASWVGLGAGLLPARLRGRAETAVLAGYGALAAYGYGLLMNLWFWPFSTGADTQLSYVAGAPVLENLHRFAVFTAVTSTFGWDTGRAITTAVAIVLAGPAVLAALRRAARRAAFDAPVTFAAPDQRPSIRPEAGPAGPPAGTSVHSTGPARPSPGGAAGTAGASSQGGGSQPALGRPTG